MNAKKIIEDFYKSDALIDSDIMKDFLHPEFLLDWNSSSGIVTFDKNEMLAYASKLSNAYTRCKVRITNIIKEGNRVSLQYSLSVKTIENPREEMLLGYFFAFWEIKDEKMYRGFQMSRLA
jgi:hypothetical protein